MTDFEDFSDFDAVDLDLVDLVDALEERAGWAESLGPVDDDRTEAEIGAEQWAAAYAEFVDSGQVTEEMVDWISALNERDYDDLIAEVETDAPDGDTP